MLFTIMIWVFSKEWDAILAPLGEEIYSLFKTGIHPMTYKIYTRS